MPQIPRRREQQVSTAPLPAVRTPATPGLEAFGGGRGVDQAFQAASGAVGAVSNRLQERQQEIERIAAEQKKRADEMVIRDADLQLAELETKLMIDVRNMRGRTAAGAVSFANQEWGKNIQEYRKSLFNDEQRLAFDNRALARGMTLNKVAMQHTDSALNEYEKQQTETSIRMAMEQAALNYDDNEIVGRSFMQIEQELIRKGEREGLGFKEDIEPMIAIARSQAHAKIMERMLVDGQDNLAKQYDRAWSKEVLDPERQTLARVRKELKESDRERKEAIHRDLFFRALGREGTEPLSVRELDQLWATDTIDATRYKELRKMVLDPFNNLEIDGDQKSKKLFELFDEMDKVKGLKVDRDARRVTSPAKLDRLDRLEGLRGWMADNKEYFNRKQYDSLMQLTQEAYDKASSGKLPLLQSLVNFFRRTDAPHDEISNSVQAAAEVLNSSENVTDQMRIEVEKIKNEFVESTNELKTKYPLGMTLTTSDGILMEVSRHDEFGNPIFRRAR